jgi:hypothetical protein
MHHQHILPQTTILRVVNASWNSLWDTRIGRRPLRSLRIDAQVVGKLFQELMTHQLHAVDPVMWPDPLAPRSAKDPDFNCIDARYSFELKMCSQKGSRHVYGNRCSSPGYMSTKGKSRDCWMMTINYTDTRINLIRFGYIHGIDWVGQGSASGNSARLKAHVYDAKLRVVKGPYQLEADPMILRGVGEKTPYTSVKDALEAGHPEARRFVDASFY